MANKHNDYFNKKAVNSNFKAKKQKNKPSFYLVVFAIIFCILGSILGSVAFVENKVAKASTEFRYMSIEVDKNTVFPEGTLTNGVYIPGYGHTSIFNNQYEYLKNIGLVGADQNEPTKPATTILKIYNGTDNINPTLSKNGFECSVIEQNTLALQFYLTFNDTMYFQKETVISFLFTLDTEESNLFNSNDKLEIRFLDGSTIEKTINIKPMYEEDKFLVQFYFVCPSNLEFTSIRFVRTFDSSVNLSNRKMLINAITLQNIGTLDDLYNRGFNAGYSDGFGEGREYGEEIGYENGYEEGYDTGKRDGFIDAYTEDAYSFGIFENCNFYYKWIREGSYNPNNNDITKEYTKNNFNLYEKYNYKFNNMPEIIDVETTPLEYTISPYYGGFLFSNPFTDTWNGYQQGNIILTRAYFNEPYQIRSIDNFIVLTSFDEYVYIGSDNTSTYYIWLEDKTYFTIQQGQTSINFQTMGAGKNIICIDIVNQLDLTGLQSNYVNTEAYNQGYYKGKQEGINEGYTQGEEYGYNKGKLEGYNEGVEDGGKYSFFSLFSSLIDAPINAFRNLFNFEIFGQNLTNFFLALFTFALIIKIIQLLL